MSEGERERDLNIEQTYRREDKKDTLEKLVQMSVQFIAKKGGNCCQGKRD